MDISNILSHSVAGNLHFFSFGLLMLAGFNIPVSEDLVFIISASIAASIIPENTFLIFTGCFLGAYFSDIIAYSIGRHGFMLIQKFGFLKNESTEKRIVSIQDYFKKYGGKTLFFGRFIPFGVRNLMFISAGLVRFNLFKFMLIDFIALSITSVVLFIIGYKFGENIDVILVNLSNYKIVMFSFFAVLVIALILKKYLKRRG